MDHLVFAEILRLRKANFDVFRTDIGFTCKETYGGNQAFTFTFSSTNTVTVSVRETQRPRYAFEVEISYERWITLEDFIVFFAPRLRPEDSDAVMANFWANTGRHFRLFDLPAELRNLIFKHAIFPTSSSQSQVPYRLKPYYRYSSGWARRKLHFRPNAALLRVSKNISAEALHLLYTDAEFSFAHPQDCNVFFVSIAAESARSVRRLDLRFSHMGYLRFFGARISSKLSFVEAPALEVIAAKIRARQFEWVALHMPHPGLITGSPGSLCDSDFPCPKKVVGWILMTVFPWVQGLEPDRLFLAGYIKDGQYSAFARKMWKNDAWRRRWLSYCDETDARMGDEMSEKSAGGVSLKGHEDPGLPIAGTDEDSNADNDENAVGVDQSVLNEPTPPRCECRTACSLTDFTRKD